MLLTLAFPPWGQCKVWGSSRVCVLISNKNKLMGIGRHQAYKSSMQWLEASSRIFTLNDWLVMLRNKSHPVQETVVLILLHNSSLSSLNRRYRHIGQRGCVKAQYPFLPSLFHIHTPFCESYICSAPHCRKE